MRSLSVILLQFNRPQNPRSLALGRMHGLRLACVRLLLLVFSLLLLLGQRIAFDLRYTRIELSPHVL